MKHGGSKADLIVGGRNAPPKPGKIEEVLLGNEGDDIILGGDGVDRLQGDDGNDLLCGGLGADGLAGGNGYDFLFTEGDKRHHVQEGAHGAEIHYGLCLLSPQWLVGDWDGDGTADLGLHSRDRALFLMPGAPAPFFFFEYPGDRPVVGDWNGDGRDQAGVLRDDGAETRFYPDGGVAAGNGDGEREDNGTKFGLAGDIPFGGNWLGLGPDTIGTFRNGLVQLDDGNGAWSPFAWWPEALGYGFGVAGDIPVSGDWNGDGFDETGVFRPSTGNWQLDGGTFGFVAPYGPYEWPPLNFGLAWLDIPIVGDWDEDMVTDLGVIRGDSLILDVHERGYQNYLLELPGAMMLR